MAGLEAFGTSLAREDDVTAGLFHPLANITSVAPPGFSRDPYDVTAHDSPDGYMEFIGGLIDGGEVSADINYDPAATVPSGPGTVNVTTALLGDFESSAPVNYEIALPNGAKFAAALLITGLEIEAPYDGKLSASLSFQVSGKPTFTAV